MSFNEPIFLFLFLPALLVLYFIIPRGLPALRNALLIFASVVFYVWGGGVFIFLLLAAALVNYFLAIALEKSQDARRSKALMAAAVIANVGVLVAFKYAAFIVGNVDPLLAAVGVSQLKLPAWGVPLGISYLTFTSVGYVVDVYRRQAKAERGFGRLLLYLLMFPKTVQGPITRYGAMAGQLGQRVVTRESFAVGVKRFTIGLAKKIIIADTVGGPAGKIFAIPVTELTPSLAWTGLLCYSLQIYFDFSGYTDMAIGVGLMLGFTLPENFNYPYVADSIRDFWRRWHVSLSTWLRDYLYIPLGGSRAATWRIYFNLVLVFVICGLWHGASWAFIVWGLYYGVFLVLERLGLDKLLESLPKPVRHVYALAIILGGWVLFNSTTLGQAIGFFGALLGVTGGHGVQDGVGAYVDAWVLVVIVAGVIGSMPVVPWIAARRAVRGAGDGLWSAATVVILVALLLAAGMLISANTYSPFIYRQF